MNKTNPEYKNKEYWWEENQQYAQPHFRLEKLVRPINALSQGRESDLLDVGCGPAALANLLQKNIHYYGIDIAIHDPTPNLIETDFVKNEISFQGKRFDFVVASGIFEYMGSVQIKKFSEIRNILKENGFFIVTYVNFDHVQKRIWPNYNNVQSIKSFENDISLFFQIDRRFPTFHHRIGIYPKRKIISSIQMPIRFSIPIISPLFAVEYIFICSTK